MYSTSDINNFKNINIDNLQVTDIFELDYIQHMQDLFSDVTGVASIITHPDGTPIAKPSNFCRLCSDIIRHTEKGLKNCMKSDKIIGKQNLNGPIVQPCLSGGLWDAGASIMVGNKHIANWLIGQVRNQDVDIKDIYSYAEEIGANKEEFLKAWEEVPQMPLPQFKKIADMLYVFANELSEKAYLNFQLKNEILARKKYEEILQKSEELLSITLQSIGDGVISTDVNGLVVEMNPVAQELCGWELEDAKSKPLTTVFKIYHSKTRIIAENPVDKVLKTGLVHGLANHTVLVSRDGKEHHISDSAAPIKNKAGEIIGVVLVFSDVTEKYITEKDLIESERSKSVLLSNLPGMAYRCKIDPDWTMEFVSEGCVTLTGFRPEDLIYNNNLNFNQLILPEFREYLWDIWLNAIKKRHFVTVEYKIKTADNTEKWVWEQGTPIYNELGEAIALEGLILDITDRKKAEEELLQKEQFLKETQLIAQLGTYALDLNKNNWTSSQVLNEIFGIDPDYTKTIDGWLNIIHPEYKNTMEDYLFNKVIFNKNRFDKKYKIIRRSDLTDRWIHGIGELVFDNDGIPVSMIGTIQDITDRIEAEETLRQSEEKYRTIFDNVQDVFYQIDAKGIIIEISPSVKYFTDFVREDLIGSPVLDLYANPRDRETLLKHLSVTGELRDYEIDLKNKFGEIRRGSLNARMVLDDNGDVLQIRGSIRDITKRKIAEDALRDSENKFHDYIKFAPHGVFVSNENGKFVEVNAAASSITGYSEIELLTMDQNNLIAPDSADSFRKHFQTAVNNGYAKDEFQLAIKDNTKKFVSVDTVRISDQRYIGFFVDISEGKQIENALKLSESYLKETQTIAQLGTYTIFFESNKYEFSDILIDIIGINDDAGFTLKDGINILHPDWKNNVFEYFKKDVLQKKSKFDKKIKIIRPVDSEERWIHCLGEVDFDEKGQPRKMIGTIQDITKRKNLAEALRSSEALYKSVLNASPDAIIVVELDGTIRMASPAALILYGAENSSQLLGRYIFDFIVENDRDRAKMNAIKMFEEYLGSVEYSILKSNGSSFYADVNGDIIWDRFGQPTGMLFIVRDVTERKKVELSLTKSKNQLKKFASHLQTVREEERELLASEIHDELGQILIVLKIDMGLLKQNVLKNTENKAIEDIITKFDDIFKLVDNTINTTRKIMTDLRPEVLYMLGFLEGVKYYLRKFGERHKIKCNFECSLTTLKLNPDQSVALFRVFQEALTNIIRHSNATEVTVSLNKTPDSLIFEVLDNGIGFSDNIPLNKNSYGIIEMRERILLFDGKLTASGMPGKGTNIKVEIPYRKQLIVVK
jgi:PAS domain S-box-containing protein